MRLTYTATRQDFLKRCRVAYLSETMGPNWKTIYWLDGRPYVNKEEKALRNMPLHGYNVKIVETYTEEKP